MDKVALQLVVCCLAATYFLLTPVIGCLPRSTPTPTPSGCTDSECDEGTCVQINTFVTRECSANNELRARRTKILPGIIRKLFRSLRKDEDAFRGLFPKDPKGTKSLQSHVGCGSRNNYRSQFISTSASLRGVQNWVALSALNNPAPDIVEIDVNCLKKFGINWVDLTNPTPEQLPGKTAFNFAKKYEEVLVEGPIPAECIVILTKMDLVMRNGLCEWKDSNE